MSLPQFINDLSGLHPEFRIRLAALFQACGGMSITSGWRSYEYQAQVYAEKPHLAAPAGSSNHGMMSTGSRDSRQGGTPAATAADISGNMDCAHQKASQFGLVFPMSHEPWHIEPAGLDGFSFSDSYTQPGFGAAVDMGPDLHDMRTHLGFLESALVGPDQPWWSPEPIDAAGGLPTPERQVPFLDGLEAANQRLAEVDQQGRGQHSTSPDPERARGLGEDDKDPDGDQTGR